MTEPAKKKAVYEDLCRLPDNMIGEIIDGELVASPRPGGKHVAVSSALGGEICPPYQFGRGGPGGWWILDEPELHLGEHVLVPDLAGWKRGRMPDLPEGHEFAIAPDWICEVLSPGTIRMDRIKKSRLYAEHGVSYLWLIDPGFLTLETFRLESGRWLLLSTHMEGDRVRAEPFLEVELDLSLLWG